MFARAEEVFASRDLLWEWTLRTLRARYQQSMLGWLWALVTPAAQAAIFSIIFTRFVPIDTGGVAFVAFVYVAVLPWNFLSCSLTDMSVSLVDNSGLVNKIYFPREVLPLAAMFARLFDLLIGCLCFGILAWLLRLTFAPSALSYLPAILGALILFVMGCGLALAALNVFLRDVRSLLMLALQLWIYASPVFYPIDAVPTDIRPWFVLNPLAGIIEGLRDVLLRGRAPGDYFYPSAVAALLVFGFGYWVFRRLEPAFADIA